MLRGFQQLEYFFLHNFVARVFTPLWCCVLRTSEFAKSRPQSSGNFFDFDGGGEEREWVRGQPTCLLVVSYVVEPTLRRGVKRSGFFFLCLSSRLADERTPSRLLALVKREVVLLNFSPCFLTERGFRTRPSFIAHLFFLGDIFPLSSSPEARTRNHGLYGQSGR